MNFSNMPHWRACVSKAEHYLAVGQQELFLSYDSTEFPWEYVTEVRPGGSHRFDIATSVYIFAGHPSGLTFRWSIDIEKREANGRNSYAIDTAIIRQVMAALPAAGREGFRTYLQSVAQALLKSGTEYRAIADRELAEAATIGELAGFVVEPKGGAA